MKEETKDMLKMWFERQGIDISNPFNRALMYAQLYAIFRGEFAEEERHPMTDEEATDYGRQARVDYERVHRDELLTMEDEAIERRNRL